MSCERQHQFIIIDFLFYAAYLFPLCGKRDYLYSSPDSPRKFMLDLFDGIRSIETVVDG